MGTEAAQNKGKGASQENRADRVLHVKDGQVTRDSSGSS